MPCDAGQIKRSGGFGHYNLTRIDMTHPHIAKANEIGKRLDDATPEEIAFYVLVCAALGDEASNYVYIPDHEPDLYWKLYGLTANAASFSIRRADDYFKELTT